MDADKIDLLGEGEWHGLFHAPSGAGTAFLGRLRYSATEGASLEYMLPGTTQPHVDGVVHGMLESGQPVTLFSRVRQSPVMPSMKNGVERIAGRFPLTAFLVGDQVDDEPMVSSLSFSTPALDEFLALDPAIVAASWPGKPVVVHPLVDGTLEVRHAMTGNGISRLSEHLMHPNPAALAALDTHFHALRKQHPNEWFMLRTSLEWALGLTFSSAVSLREAYRRVSAVCDLLALLIRTPVHPVSISFAVGDGPNRKSVQFCPTNVLEEGTVREATRNRDHRQMPVTHANARLSTILPAWLQHKDDHLVMVSGLQHSTGWQTRHDTFGAIVLYVAQLESIHHLEVGKGNGKYEYALKTYASPRLLAYMQGLFGVASLADLASGVWDLRNEIGHYGRPKVQLPKLAWTERVGLSICLELVVVGWVLRRLGLDEATVHAFMDAYAPY